MPAVTRVLPWRRHQLPAAEKVGPLVEQFRNAHPKASSELITRAYEVAEAAHEGQMRRSGEPYITHPLAVATIVAHFGLDETTIVAALLHDVAEDTDFTLADIEKEFGAEVAALVDGVTKLDRIHFDSKEAQQAAAIRKMLVAMADDIRVLVIKLADRLHNMRTIAALPADKQEKTAWETMDVYAPLAHRLGMGELKQQLEDLCFAALHPKRYAEIDHMVATRSPERELYLTQVEEEVRSRLAEVQIQAEVTGRPKHMWSIYEKMVVRGKEFDEVQDLVGVRVVVVEPGAVASSFVANAGVDPHAMIAAAGPYGPAAAGYLARTAGAFANAQSSADAAAVIVSAVVDPGTPFRVQTSAVAAGFVGVKLADLDGSAVQALTSSWVATA